MSSTSGVQSKGFISPLKNLTTKQRAGKVFLKLAEGELPFPPVRLPTVDADGKIPGYVICGSSDGRMLAFPPSEVNVYTGGVQGVGLMVLEGDQRLTAVLHSRGTPPLICKLKVSGKEIAAKLSGNDWDKHVGHRARKGSFLPKKGTLVA